MTRINQLLNISYPLLQGGMAHIADASLAAAVSNGGGLGIIGAGGRSSQWLQQEIRACKKATSKPFGVNIMLLANNVGELMEVACQEKVAVVTTGAGNPGKYMDKLKAAHIKVIPVVSNVTLARRVQRSGADAVIAEGSEAGGHIGETTTMALIPQIVDALDIPVIAAGGIGDGRGIAAAFMLGAEGVQLGTRFLLAKECSISPAYKEMIRRAKDSSSVEVGHFTGHPVRGLKNKLTRQLLEAEKNQDEKTYYDLSVGALHRAAQEGDVEYGAVMAGEIAGLLCKEQPAAAIIQELFQEAAEVYENRNLICRSGGAVPGHGSLPLCPFPRR